MHCMYRYRTTDILIKSLQTFYKDRLIPDRVASTLVIKQYILTLEPDRFWNTLNHIINTEFFIFYIFPTTHFMCM